MTDLLVFGQQHVLFFIFLLVHVRSHSSMKVAVDDKNLMMHGGNDTLVWDANKRGLAQGLYFGPG